jgi:hypothetical protein
VIDFVEAATAQVSREVHRLGNGPQNLDAVREAVLKSVTPTTATSSTASACGAW